MTDIDTTIQELLTNRGIAVAGTSERALCREDALSCVALLSHSRAPILGGDVYYVRGRALEPAYANWHVERSAGESETTFLEKSFETARSYIQAFPEQPGSVPVFVIVASES